MTDFPPPVVPLVDPGSAVLPVHEYGTPPPPAKPIADADRIDSIDILRGFAVMGILLVNIQFMALPMQQVEDLKWRTLPFLDGAARLIVQLFFEMKFITLFSLLFGAGLAIQMERLERTGRPFVSVYVRRLLVLLVIGILHGVLLWYGDILTVYAILGFAALLFRKCRPRTLIIWAAALFIVPVAGMLTFAAIDPNADWSTPSWGSYAGATSNPASQLTTSATSAAAAAPPDAVTRFLTFLDSESRVYRAGSFGEVVGLRTSYFVIANLFVMPILYLWRCLAMFLLGMAAVKLRIISTDHVRPRWALAVAFCVIGLALEIYADRIQHQGGVLAAPMARGFSLTYLGSFALAMAYAIAILGLAGRASLQPLFRPVGAMGRMALSNYLGHSVIGGLIFYSHGLGLFGTVTSAGLFGIACAIIVVQLIVSPIWLRRFQFGPVEWLWRSATYGRLQPMRRPTA